eukprot:139741_1
MSNDTGYYVGSYIVYVWNIVYTTVFLILTVYKTSCTQKSTIHGYRNRLSNSIKFITISHILFYLLHFATLFPFQPTDTELVQKIFIYSTKFCIVSAECLFYVLLLVRLHSTFNLTSYALSKCSLYIYTMGILLLFLFWILYEFVFYTISVNVPTPSNIQSSGYMCFIIVLCNIILGTVLVYSFNSRLFSLVTSQRRSISPSIAVGNDMYNNEETYEVELNPRQSRLIETIVKVSLLNTIAIIFFQILLILWGLYELDIIENHSNTELLIKQYIMSVSIFVEVFCVYLSFAFNARLYKCLCGRVHTVCHTLCSKTAKKEMKRPKRGHKVTESDANYQFLL